jgi:hypothetical protein
MIIKMKLEREKEEAEIEVIKAELDKMHLQRWVGLEIRR